MIDFNAYEGRVLRKDFDKLIPVSIFYDDFFSVQLAESEGVARVLHVIIEPVETALKEDWAPEEVQRTWKPGDWVISEVNSFDMPLDHDKYGDFDVFLDWWTDEEEADFDRKIEEYMERICAT